MEILDKKKGSEKIMELPTVQHPITRIGYPLSPSCFSYALLNFARDMISAHQSEQIIIDKQFNNFVGYVLLKQLI